MCRFHTFRAPEPPHRIRIRHTPAEDPLRDWDPGEVARQVVRALRGRRSQVQLSRRLGYRSNVVYRWEAGLRTPAALEVVRLAARVGVDPEAAWRTYDAGLAEEAGPGVGTAEHLRRWLGALRRGRTLAEIAARSGLSGPAVQRMLSGRAQVPFDSLLVLIDGLDERVVDFVATLVPLDAVPALGPHRVAQQAQREQSFRLRWTEAVLAALEVHGDAPEPQAPAIAAALGRDEAEVREILDALVATGGLQRRGERWQVPRDRRVNTTVDPARHRAQARLWAEAAMGYEPPVAGRGYLVLSLADADVPALLEIGRAAYAAMVELAARSPPERVLLVATQTVALDGRPLDVRATSRRR